MPKKPLKQKTKCLVCRKQFTILKNKKKTCGAKFCKAKIKKAYDREYIKKYYQELKMIRDLIFKYIKAEQAVRDFLKKMEKQTKQKTGKANRILITSNNFLKLKSLIQKADSIKKKLQKQNG